MSWGTEEEDPCLTAAKAAFNGRLDSVIKVKSAFDPLDVKKASPHLEILNLPINTLYGEINDIFAKYGTVRELRLFYQLDKNVLHCHLTFENEDNSAEALSENGREVQDCKISVMKYTKTSDTYESDAERQSKRKRAEHNAGEWGSRDFDQSSYSRGGSSRGRGGCAARGGSRACHSCGEEGHFARDCPTKPRSRACFNCGEEGHMSRDCSKPRTGGRGRGRGSYRGGRSDGDCGSSWDSNPKVESTWGDSGNAAPTPAPIADEW